MREEVIPHLVSKGVLLSDEDKTRLLYYVKYHDERVSFTPEYLKCHLKLADEQSFRKLMLLEIADAKAHIIKPVVKQRIDACSLWVEFITEK